MPYPVAAVRGKESPQTGITITYLLKDEFTSAVSPTIPSPHTSEPGPGTWTITDSGGKLSIASGSLTTSGATGANDPRLHDGASRVRAAGLATGIIWRKTTGISAYVFGWGNTNAGRPQIAIMNLATASVQFQNSYSDLAVSNDVDYACVLSLRSAGSFYFIRISGVWYLGLLANDGTSTPLYASLGAANADTDPEYFDKFHVASLPAPFATDYGLADGYTASPASGATLTHSANCCISLKWTAKTDEILDIAVRSTDADNRWIIRCNQAGGTLKIFEKSGGTETERATSSQTWTNNTAYNIFITARGSKIYTFVNVIAKASYSSASFNSTATAAEISGFTAAAEFAAFPSALSGTAAAVLDAFAG